MTTDGAPTDVTSLESRLSEPSDRTISTFQRMSGDLLVLGAGGKMGPSLVRMAQRAADASQRNCRVIAVSRFSDDGVRRQLSDFGVVTLSGDLLDSHFIRTLPDCENVMFMAGFKFGATGS